MIHDVDPSQYSMYSQESINSPCSGAIQLQEVICMVTAVDQEFVCVCHALIDMYVLTQTDSPTSDLLGWQILFSFE